MYINVLEYIQDWVNENLTANVFQKVSESFYTISFEYYRAGIRHLGCMNVLAYARICGPVSMSDRDQVKLILVWIQTQMHIWLFVDCR